MPLAKLPYGATSSTQTQQSPWKRMVSVASCLTLCATCMCASSSCLSPFLPQIVCSNAFSFVRLHIIPPSSIQQCILPSAYTHTSQPPLAATMGASRSFFQIPSQKVLFSFWLLLHFFLHRHAFFSISTSCPSRPSVASSMAFPCIRHERLSAEERMLRPTPPVKTHKLVLRASNICFSYCAPLLPPL